MIKDFRAARTLTRKRLLGLAIAAIVAVTLYLALNQGAHKHQSIQRRASDDTSVSTDTAKKLGASGISDAAQMAGKIAPGRTSGAKKEATPERKIIDSALSFRTAWEQLVALDTPRSKSMRAAIVEACINGPHADRHNSKFWLNEIVSGKDVRIREGVRKTVASRLPRVLCSDLPSEILNQGNADALLLDASKGGDTIAKLRELSLRMSASPSDGAVLGADPKGAEPQFLQVPTARFTENDVSLLKSALLSGDLSSVWLALPIMYTTSAQEQFWIGDRPLSQAELTPLANLLGCDLGGICDATSPTVAEQCVLKGLCETQSVEDYYRLSLSRSDWDAVDYARNVIRNGMLTDNLATIQLKPTKLGEHASGWAIPLKPYPIRIR
jgi:hypothetical protein